jgi:hypothetical protein
MTEDYWDGNEDTVEESLEDTGYNTFVRVNNANVPVEPGNSFKDVVKSIAQDAGLGKFRVYLNGDEVKPDNAPETFGEGMRVELRPYDIAG